MRPYLASSSSARRLGVVAVAVGALACFGCTSPQGGTDVGNGRTIKLDLQAYKAGPAVTTKSMELSGGVIINLAYMALDRVRLVPGASCEDEHDDSKFDIEGSLVADLLDGMVTGDATFGTEFTEFCELKLGMHPVDLEDSPADTPPAMDGLSLWVEGLRGDDVTFTVKSDLDERFELKAKNGSFSLPANMTRLIVGFRMDDWIGALDLDSLGDQHIVVDEQTNQDALKDFEDAVKESARLFRDQNDNDYLDDDEHDEDDVLAD